MNRRLFLGNIIVAVLAWPLAGCRKHGGSAIDSNVDYYTCAMHPSVRSHDPHAKCPICSMDLVPVFRKGLIEAAAPGTAAGPVLNEFKVPVERQQQIGVTYATAEITPLRLAIRSAGVVSPDRARRWEFVARVSGYVQKLHVTSPGEPVEEGQPLLAIYSPELATAGRELINLLNARDRVSTPAARVGAEQSIDAARMRLEQWNVLPSQIAELEKTRQPADFLTLNSPFKGVVEAVPVEQGRAVTIGDPLVVVADLSTVWVWAEFYEDELSLLRKGQRVRITAASCPGQAFEGELSLIDPFLSGRSRTVKVRIDIPNPETRLRPGMYVNVDLAIDMGQGLTIPAGAVLPTGSRTIVFLDKGEGKLEPRAVRLGRKYIDRYEVLGGLKKGERVVTSANFLIDAESKVQGAVKSFLDPQLDSAEGRPK